MFFKKGERVVCIDDVKDNPLIDVHFKQWIKEGEIYTVRGTSLDLKGEQGILLTEVKNPLIYSSVLGGNFEPRFAARRFKKLDELVEEIKKQEIEELVA